MFVFHVNVSVWTKPSYSAVVVFHWDSNTVAWIVYLLYASEMPEVGFQFRAQNFAFKFRNIDVYLLGWCSDLGPILTDVSLEIRSFETSRNASCPTLELALCLLATKVFKYSHYHMYYSWHSLYFFQHGMCVVVWSAWFSQETGHFCKQHRKGSHRLSVSFRQCSTALIRETLAKPRNLQTTECSGTSGSLGQNSAFTLFTVHATPSWMNTNLTLLSFCTIPSRRLGRHDYLLFLSSSL